MHSGPAPAPWVPQAPSQAMHKISDGELPLGNCSEESVNFSSKEKGWGRVIPIFMQDDWEITVHQCLVVSDFRGKSRNPLKGRLGAIEV